MTPVILFAYNRSNILPRTIECLKNNKIDLLYIFSDGPKDVTDEIKVDKVRKILDQIDWVKTEKFYQKKNLGLSASVIFGVNKVLEKYESVICVEDDICVAPEFYSYMQTCLEKYKDDQEISGITGIRFSFPKENLENYPYDVAILPHFSSWGWGTWKRFWKKVDFNRDSLIKKIKLSKADIISAKDDLEMMTKWLIKGEINGGWDVYCNINMRLNKQSFIWPTWNMVENSGLEEGTHINERSIKWQLIWEKRNSSKSTKLRFPKTDNEQEKIRSAFFKFLQTNRASRRKINRIILVLKNIFITKKSS
ncbi:MAG: glycosyltransferase [Patescibacteria group bacterium]|jgi:glycosyltransferase involved in cell wall biosynthesis